MTSNTINKVAAITLSFWIMKICATTLGETAGDLLSMTMNVGYGISSLILLGLFFISLVSQIMSSKFHPVLFWTVILTTSTAGTTMSDFMDRTLELGYMKGSIILVSGLLAVLFIWHICEKSISVNKIQTTRTEIFYWIAILFSNTLGTAFGDFLADDSGLEFLGGAILVGGMIALIALAYRFTKLNRVFLFWTAFVLTRPFGATFGDLLTKPTNNGGLGFGTIGSSLVLFVILAGALYYTIMRGKGSEQTETEDELIPLKYVEPDNNP